MATSFRPEGAARMGWTEHLWMLPAAVLYAGGLFVPLAITLAQAAALGGSGWRELLTNPLFTRAALNTLGDGVLITVISVALAYSIAAAIWRTQAATRTVLTTLVVIAFLTTILVKIVAFKALLRDNGVVNMVLQALELVDEPVRMVPGKTGVIVGMIQFVLPFAVFPILGVMLRLDRRLEQAASSLGAPAWRAFIHVALPLTLPGVIAAALLVFVISTGFYVIPAALGTPRDSLLANVVALYALNLLDFKVASAVAVVLVAVVSILTLLYQRAEQASR